MPSTRSLNGLTSKEWALMNSGVTAFMLEPLYNRAQLLSSLILTQAMFSSPLQWVSGSGFKKGPFWDILMHKEPHLGMLAEWLLTSEGSSIPSFSSPLLHLNTLSGWSYQGHLDNLSWDDQDCHIWNNFNFSFDTTASIWQNKQYTQQTDLLLLFHLRFLHPLQLKTQPLLPLHAFHLSLLQHFCFLL